jgi:hypothetical protein
MAYPFEWIPKIGNHPEKVAGKEYTPSLGGFTRGCGGFEWHRLHRLRKKSVLVSF